ncbi:MAG: chemotaxis protein CheX [Planctomycetes bacterium]|nr:chemotaxis protein CheX [Planctomycetota bacterium]
MRAEHVNPFVTAVQLVFETMLDSPVAVARPKLKSASTPSYDVTGIISLGGDVVGSAALSFPMETASAAVKAFTGNEVAPDDAMFADAIGELANMVTGNAKKDLHNLSVNISVPTVVIGRNHHLASHQLGPWVVLECGCGLGAFNIEVCVAEVAALAATGVKR